MLILLIVAFSAEIISDISHKNGFYQTNADYYKNGGGVFESIPHYESMFNKK